MTLMKRWILTLAVAVLAAAGQLAAAQTVVPQGSDIGFVSRQLGVPVEGRFTAWKAELVFDPKTPAAGRVAFTIDTGSARFGNAETDGEVKKTSWFDVAKFPQASFQSTAIKAAAPGKYEVTGKLTIKGQSRDVTVPVSLDGSVASGSFTIKRLEFRIGDGEWADTSMVANDVLVKFKLQLAGLGK
jgi:polyisoprenoid-binding protein YceI